MTSQTLDQKFRVNMIVARDIGAQWRFSQIRDDASTKGKDLFAIESGEIIEVVDYANWPAEIDAATTALWNKEGWVRVTGLSQTTKRFLGLPLPSSQLWGDEHRMTQEQTDAIKKLDPFAYQWWIEWNTLRAFPTPPAPPQPPVPPDPTTIDDYKKLLLTAITAGLQAMLDVLNKGKG